MSDKMRQEFEEWAESEYYNTLSVGGVYKSGSTAALWQAWQASRDALVVELPKPEESHFGAMPYEMALVDGINAMLEDCQVALDAAGVSYK